MSTDTRAAGRRATWRAALLASAAAGALPWPGSPALAQCATTGTNQTCTNSVVITGGATGIFDNATLTLINTVTGTVNGTNFGVDAATAANVTNSGTISGTVDFGISSSGAITLNNSATGIVTAGNAALNTVGAVTVTNDGTIFGSSFGIFSGSADVTNTGSITGFLAGIFAANDATVVNSGTVTSGGFNGIQANGNANVTNTATITGDDIGIFTGGDLTLVNGPGATITGTTQRGIRVGGNADITNSGTITTTTGTDGIFVIGDATITNNGGGIISGNIGLDVAGNLNLTNAGAISANSGQGVFTGGNATVTNFGSIASSAGFEAISAIGGATVTNSGTITGDTIGIRANNDVTVTNSGTIAGTTVHGIQAGGNATIVNIATGDITGNVNGIQAGGNADVTNSGLILGLGGNGIRAIGNVTVVNNSTGQIAGDEAITALAGGSSIFNAGTITATGVFNQAIQFAGIGNTLTIAPTSSIMGNVVGTGNDTFQLGGTGVGAFDVSTLGAAQQYQGFSIFNKVGQSVWTVTGTSTYTGATNVQAGALIVNGDITSSSGVTVNAGGILGGTGTLPSTVIGGTLAPGNSIGTINVTGNVTFNVGSTYAVEVNAAGQSDRTVATGTATLNGGTVAVTASSGNYAPSTIYTILTAAGGVAGTFAGSTLGGANPAFFSTALSYDPNNVFLTLAFTQGAFGGFAGTPNQSGVAGTLDALGTGAPLFNELIMLNASGLANAYNQLSGEAHASAAGILGGPNSPFAGAIHDRMTAAFGAFGDPAGSGAPLGFAPSAASRVTDAFDQFVVGRAAADAGTALAYAPDAAPSSRERGLSRFVWASGSGWKGSYDGNANAAAASTSGGGAFGGFDLPLAENVRVGAVGGWSQTTIDVDGRSSRTKADTWHAGGYAAAALGHWRLRARGGYSGHELDSTRGIAIGATASTASARYRADQVDSYGEIAQVWRVAANTAIEPYAGGGATWLRTAGFTETGAGAANLTADAQSDVWTYSAAGARLATTFVAGGVAITPRVDLGWRHVYSNIEPSRTFAFAVAPALPFTVAGAPIARDALLVNAGVDATVSERLHASINYRGEIAESARMHAVTGALVARF